MGKPWNMRIKPAPQKPSSVINKRKNNAHAKIAREMINEKDAQFEAAVKWCHDNSKRGWAALKTGNFTLINDARAINSRLDGLITTKAEYESRSILTNHEEETLVAYLKNMNRCNQGVSRSDTGPIILKFLRLRQLQHDKYPKRYKPLSKVARDALEENNISLSFFRRFESKYPDLTRKRQGNVNMNRALNCSRDMARDHLDDLAAELIRLGIFTDAEQQGRGQWTGKVDLSRIYNFDETPQFINFGVDGTANALVYAGRGEECKVMIRENRECVTICPFVSFNGDIDVCQVIFKGKGINNHMVHPDIPNLFVSVTENGVQDKKSLEHVLKYFNTRVEKRKVTKPILMTSDGHSSRFSTPSLTFLFSKSVEMFLGPPDTTGLTQLLDQINQALHSHYRKSKRNLFTNDMTIDRDGFMAILAEVWKTWTSPDGIRKAAKVVGVSSEGLNIDWMNQEKMDKAEMLLAEEKDAVSGTPSKAATVNDIADSQTPVGMRRNSNQHLKFQLQRSEARAEILKKKLDTETEINLDGIPGFLEPRKVKPKKKKSVRITQVYGSLSGCDILSKLEEIEEKKEEDAKMKEAKIQATIDLKKKFELCKQGCMCEGGKCSMAEYRQCPVCLSVKKSVCSKKGCKQENGSKPEMIRVNQPSTSKANTAVSGKRKFEESGSDSDASISEDWFENQDTSDEEGDVVDYPQLDERMSEVRKRKVGSESSNSAEFTEGMHVIVYYEGSLFPGKVTEVFNDGVQVSCMRKSSSIGSFWKWPETVDSEKYPFDDVRFKNVCLEKMPGTKRKVEFHVAELDDVWGDIYG